MALLFTISNIVWIAPRATASTLSQPEIAQVHGVDDAQPLR